VWAVWTPIFASHPSADTSRGIRGGASEGEGRSGRGKPRPYKMEAKKKRGGAERDETGKEKEGPTETGPLGLNHFDDTLAEDKLPHRPTTTKNNGRTTGRNEKGGWCKPPFLS
jgi:hypothetical protein